MSGRLLNCAIGAIVFHAYGSLPQTITKKALPQSLLGQDFHPAVPPKLTQSARSFHVLDIRAVWITGTVPVGRYSLLAFAPPSAVHSAGVPCRDLTIRDSLKGLALWLTSLPHRFLIDCFALYAGLLGLSTVNFYKAGTGPASHLIKSGFPLFPGRGKPAREIRRVRRATPDPTPLAPRQPPQIFAEGPPW